MREKGLTGIPLYPELRNCPAPSAARVLDIFDNVQRHVLVRGDEQVQAFEPELTPLQSQVLDLLHIPEAVYSSRTTA